MKKSLGWLLVLISIWIANKTAAQSEVIKTWSYPCQCNKSVDIKILFKGEVITHFNISSNDKLGELASSFLLPFSPRPKLVYPEDGGLPDNSLYVQWSCTFSTSKIIDGNPETAWVEGVNGSGIGEVVLVPGLDLKKPVRIWAGCGKSPLIFNANNRPRKLQIAVIRAIETGIERTDVALYEEGYDSLKIISKEIVSLEDKNDYQNLPIPDFNVEIYYNPVFKDTREYKYFLGIEILEVYRGTRYDGTGISEISN
jgi:hypothetical protein